MTNFSVPSSQILFDFRNYAPEAVLAFFRSVGYPTVLAIAAPASRAAK